MDWLTDLFGGPLGTNLFGGGATSGAGRLYDGMPVPGLPETGKPPGGLLSGSIGTPTLAGGVGTDTLQPAPAAAPGTPVEPASGPLPTGAPTPLTGPGSDKPAGVGTVVIDRPRGGAGRADGPPLATAQQAADAKVTPGTPPAVTGLPATVPADPATTGTTGTPAAAPAAGAAAKPEETPFLQRFNEALGKAQIGGGQKPTPPRGAGFPSPGSMGGDPTAGSRQGAADLLSSILTAHRKLAPGASPVPKFPESLLRRF